MQGEVNAEQLGATMPPGYRGGKVGFTCGKAPAHLSFPPYVSRDDDDFSSSSSSSSDDSDMGEEEAIGKRKKVKTPPPPYMRRLRTAAPKRPRECDDEGEDDCDKKRVCEPRGVRKADSMFRAPHPAIIFMRDHIPIKPCGRCRLCRAKPCGKCANCKNNAHLAERSHDRKRCTALGCTRLTDAELDRFRMTQNSEDAVSQLQSDLRSLRGRLMAAKNVDVTKEMVAELKQEQDTLVERLKSMTKASEDMGAMSAAPEGYECLLLSFQTLETERDRIARLIDRRTTRDSPEVMRTRRQLRNYYAVTICSMVDMFADDVVSRAYVDQLRDISSEYEKLVYSMPIVDE